MMPSKNQASQTETHEGYMPPDNDLRHPEDISRHPELVSGSGEDSAPTAEVLKQVQDDEYLTTDAAIASSHGHIISDPPQSLHDNDPPPPSKPPSPNRIGGWTGSKMIAFLEALIETCSVSAAAQSVSMSRSAAYRLRARLANTAFDRAWEHAFDQGMQQVAHAALDRTINGVLQPVYYQGKQVGERRVFNENLTWKLINASWERTAWKETSEDWQQLLDQVEHDSVDGLNLPKEDKM